MFALLFLSAWNDSAIMDELAHIPAGYSYIMERDMRLNPEHPPLAKDLAGLALAFLHPNFPTHVKPWAEDINGQWDMGSIFLYHAGNNPDQILHWARFPFMLLTILLGWMLYQWTSKRFGSQVGLLTLFFFALSPTFLAHSRYVTTDLAASFGFFIGIAAFIDFLEAPTRRNIIRAGIAFGIAELLKFSLFLLVPLYGIAALAWILVAHDQHLQQLPLEERWRHRVRYGAALLGKVVLIGLIGFLVVWGVYEYHVWNYPADRQLRDATQILSSYGNRTFVNLDFWLIRHNPTRALGQYMLGLLMVVQRAAGGNTTYFWGEVSSVSWWYYFPVAYALKETLAFHLLTLLALGSLIAAWAHRARWYTRAWMREHFAEAFMFFFIIFYWAYSMHTNLNIGVRHILPTFPFIYLLVSKRLLGWLHFVVEPNPQTTRVWLQDIYRLHIQSIPKYLMVIVLAFWAGFQAIATFPHYLSYFNELVGSDEGYRYITDSNYDWGQDLKRLADYVNKHNIDHISLDYFGGGSPEYYLGDKFQPWSSSRGPASGYFAISATFRQGAYGTPIRGLVRKPEDSYLWLKPYEPIARAGKSIFIYQLPPTPGRNIASTMDYIQPGQKSIGRGRSSALAY